MFNNIISLQPSFEDPSKKINLYETSLESIVDAGNVPRFQNFLRHSVTKDTEKKVLYFLCKRIILEGFKASIRAERLKEMLHLLILDQRFSKIMTADFFNELDFEESYCSFKAVLFWKCFTQMAPQSPSLDPTAFFNFILRSTSNNCDSSELKIVDACVSELIKKINFAEVEDLYLCIHHYFFPIIYANWTHAPIKILLTECCQKEGQFYARNLHNILKKNEVEITFDDFDRILQNHCFTVALSLISQRVHFYGIQKHLNLAPLSVYNDDADQKNLSLRILMRKLKNYPHMEVKVKQVYFNALEKCAEEFTEFMDLENSQEITSISED